ncbi:MAG TPA: hypothetical protein VLL52_22985 [Anaerolineae bacterium]|nr:hypothetical protein [Anaerolineae bacterium]
MNEVAMIIIPVVVITIPWITMLVVVVVVMILVEALIPTGRMIVTMLMEVMIATMLLVITIIVVVVMVVTLTIGVVYRDFPRTKKEEVPPGLVAAVALIIIWEAMEVPEIVACLNPPMTTTTRVLVTLEGATV